jgi:hypothetical protein
MGGIFFRAMMDYIGEQVAEIVLTGGPFRAYNLVPCMIRRESAFRESTGWFCAGLARLQLRESNTMSVFNRWI